MQVDQHPPVIGRIEGRGDDLAHQHPAHLALGDLGREQRPRRDHTVQRDGVGAGDKARPFAIVLRRAQHQVARQAGRGGDGAL